MRRRLVLLSLAAAALWGCDRTARVSVPTITQSLKGVLVYPRSQVVSMSSGDSAGQMRLTSPDSPEQVAGWFRTMLVLNHWSLESDSRQVDGSFAMYAERARQPLWIAIEQNSGGPGTTYSVTGAIAGSVDSTVRADSAPAHPDSAAQRSGSSMSSKRIHRR